MSISILIALSFRSGLFDLLKLITPKSTVDFKRDRDRIFHNFDLIYSTPKNVGQLRQAFLQLAVMGKLVPQKTTDEPASVLLEKIQAEKARLVKEGNSASTPRSFIGVSTEAQPL